MGAVPVRTPSALLAIALLAGCATAPVALQPIDVPRPIPVACVKELPAAPEGLARTLEDDKRMLGPIRYNSAGQDVRGEALDLQRRLWRARAIELEGILRACILGDAK